MSFEETIHNIDIFDKISVIAAHPAFNVHAATTALDHDDCFRVYDLDRGRFFMNLGVTEENWVDLYIDHIKLAISNCHMRKRLSGDDIHRTYVIFINDRQEVRQALEKENIPFIWVRPAEMADDWGYWSDILHKYDKRNLCHYGKMDSEDAKVANLLAERRQVREAEIRATLEKTEEVPLSNQFVLDMPWTGEWTIANLVYCITKIPIGYATEHAITGTTKSMLRRHMIKHLTDKLIGRSMSWYLSKTQVAISSQGYEYLVMSSRRTHKTLRKFAEKCGISNRVAERLANQGSDFILLSRDDASEILSMLNEAICRLESGTRSDNDVEVFGDRAIAYERLIDELDHTVLPVDAKAEEHE